MKLYYFDVPGKAEAIRLLLTHAGVTFEDIRFTPEEWPKYKDKFELKQVPVLEEDGKMYCQSLAILEYLGKKYGYLPKKNYEQHYKIMKTIYTAEELFQRTYFIMSPSSPYNEEDKEKQKQKLFKETGPVFLKSLEKTLGGKRKNNFIIGRKYTIADFCLLGLYRTVKTNKAWNELFFNRLVKKAPKLYIYLERRLKDFNHYYKVCKPKLYYFNSAGRAEMIRVLLKYVKVDYEDVRMTWQEWPQIKAQKDFELKQVPVFECEPCGLKLCQSHAIMQRFGEQYGLLPQDAQKFYEVLWWCNTTNDVMEGCWINYIASADKKKDVMQNLIDKIIPNNFHTMECYGREIEG